MKVLVFTTDVIPIAGLPTSGTALRTFGIIEGLRSHGHEVHVSVPRSALAGLLRKQDISSLSPEAQRAVSSLKELAFDSSNQPRILAEVGPDVILCGHWPAMSLRTKPSQALVIDLAGPHLLERHYQKAPNQKGAIRAKLSALATADYYIVSGAKQRLYFLSYLMRTSVRAPESRMVRITMPLSPSLPAERTEIADPAAFPRFIFGGVFLPWQNPSAGLEQLSKELDRRQSGQLKLIGGQHPNYRIAEGLYADLFSKLAENSRIETHPMLPYDQFVGHLSNADVAIDLMAWNLERELAMTIRSTTYLWAGVPVIYNDYADLGDLIEEYDAGWCVSPDNTDALSAVFDSIYADPEAVIRKSQNARRLAQERFSWDRAVLPLLDLLSRPGATRSGETDIIMDFPDSANFPVMQNKSVEQYFVCRMDGLNKVECRLATHDRQIDRGVRFQLFEVDRGDFSTTSFSRESKRRLVVEREADASSIRNNDWLSLEVSPVEDSAGKTFLFRIEADAESETSSISPWAVKGSPYPLLGLFHGERKVEQSSLCLRTTCSSSE